jgi:aspartate 1-decarboxylase
MKLRVICKSKGSGEVVLNGAAARHFHKGDRVIIVAFCLTDEPVVPHMIAVDRQNRFVKFLSGPPSPEDLPSERHAIEA